MNTLFLQVPQSAVSLLPWPRRDGIGDVRKIRPRPDGTVLFRVARSLGIVLCCLTAGAQVQAAQMSDSFTLRPRESGATTVFSADTTAATIEPGELPDIHGNARDHTVWAQWTAPASGWVTIDTGATSFIGAMVAVYTGTEIGALTAVARGFDPDGADPNPARVRFPVAVGTSYQIMLDSTTDSTAGDGPGEVKVVLLSDSEVPASVPGQDVFAFRGLLAGSKSYGVANTVKASADPLEPLSIGRRRQTVWWQWTAPAVGIVTLDTLDSGFDTVLVVYAGSVGGGMPFAGLDEVAANNQVLNSTRSRVDFRTEAGRSYQIMVDGYPDSTDGRGNVILRLSHAADLLPPGIPGGDDFERRGMLSGSNAVGIANNTLFGVEALEPANPGFHDQTAWWEWTAPADGMVVMDTFGSDFDTALTVFRGSAFAGLENLASSNDAPASLQSRLTFHARRGQIYQILVDGYPDSNAGHGNAVLNVNQTVSPQQPDLAINGAVEIEIFARRGVTYQLQWSSDLIHWQNSGSPFPGNNEPVRFFESSRVGSPRYYRYLKR